MLGRADNVRFYLFIEGREPILIPEPKGYEDGNGYTYELENESGGILVTRENSLEYYGLAYGTLTGLYATDGIVTEVREWKEIKNPYTLANEWVNVGSAFLDISDMEVDEERKTVTTGSIQGGLKQEIDNAWAEEYDLTLENSQDEIDIGDPTTINVNIDSRRIYQKSKMFVPLDEDGSALGVGSFIPRAIPLNVEYQSSDNINSIYNYDSLPFTTGEANEIGQVGAMFYLTSETTETLTIKGNLEINYSEDNPAVSSGGIFYVGFAIYENDTLNFLRTVDLYGGSFPNGVVQGNHPRNVSIDINETITLEKGQSISLFKFINTDYLYVYGDSGITIEVDSDYPSSVTKSFLPKDLFERLIASATGKQMRFKSTLFTDGDLALLAVAPIWWIRQFPDIINEGEDDERRIQAVMSLQDAYDSYNAVRPLAWWIEKEGDVEVMRIELKSYTRQNFIGAHYGKISNGIIEYYDVSDYKWDTLPDNFHKTITVGSEIGGDNYEEVEGLRSVGGQATFKTVNTNGGEDYEVLSKIAMAAEYGEIPRRKPFTEFPDVDTRFDSNWVFLDLKIVNGSYFLRKWQDDLEIKPTGIYDPDSAWNLRLTPAQILLNHNEEIKVGLAQINNKNKNIRWISSDCNSSLITKKVGEDQLEESGIIPHTRLEDPKITPILDKFSFPVDYQLEQQLNGTTNIGGEEVPNWFGQIAYQKNGVVSYGYLVKVDTNKEGSHEIVQAYNR